MMLTLSQRRWLVLAFGLVALLDATGLAVSHVFHQPTLLKYGVTVIAPLLLGVLVVSENPLAVMSCVLVIAAPFAGYAMDVKGIEVPLLVPLLVIAAYCAAVRAPSAAPRSALAAGGLLMALALVIPLADSPAVGHVLSTLVSLFAAAYLAARASAEERGFSKLAWAFLASAALQAGLALWERSTGHRLNLYGAAGAQTFTDSGYFFGYLGSIRPPGAFYDPISLGNMLALAVPLAAGLAIAAGRARDWTRAGLAAGTGAVVLAGLVVTLDRASWIGALAGLAVTLWLIPGSGWRRLVIVLVLGAGAAALAGGLGGQSTLAQRADSILHPLSETGTGNGDVLRIELWRRAFDVAQAHPVAGIGLGRLSGVLGAEFAPAGTQGHAHSVYLQLAAEGGVIALIGLLAVLLALRRDLWRLRRADTLWGAVLSGSAVAMLLCWVTDVTIRYSGVAVVMGALFGMIAGRARSARALSRGA